MTPLAMMFAIVSGGGGHGHYLYAKLFYPFSLLGPHFLPDRRQQFAESITTPWIILAFAQFPLYGWLIGAAVKNKRTLCVVCLAILLVHAIAVAMSFGLSNFS